MEDVVKSICCNAHGEVFVGKKRTRKRRGRKDGCWRERKKKNSGNVGNPTSESRRAIDTIKMYNRRSEEKRDRSH
jgi:hypothetical protein